MSDTSNTHPDDKKFLQVLQENWGYSSFRGIQLDIIRSLYAGNDTLGLMPTGGGKSITFQTPALLLDGICIVVTPLIALMKDQVSHLRERGILACAIYSGQSADEMNRHLDNCILGHNKFLYVSPERLSSPLFQNKLKQMEVSFITIDEAHCISQWGYDFRPSYLHIAEIRDTLPDVPLLALTATATPRVIDDIQRILCFREPGKHVFRMSFERKNLQYIVRPCRNKEEMLIHILSRVDGPAIVYTRNREGTRDVARMLCDAGIPALYYHAGLTRHDKDVRQRAWQEEETRVIVATNAFGMGIDKANVRLVIHTDVPDSIEAYFQEAGRAGRDGKRAYAVLLWNERTDTVSLNRRIQDNYPPKGKIKAIYNDLGSFFQLAAYSGTGASYEFNLDKFCLAFRHFPTTVVSALQILTRAEFIDFRDEDDNQSRLIFLTTRDELYRLTHLPKDADRIMSCVLRNYAGVFSNYVFIDESLIVDETGLDKETVYQNLLMLSQQRILDYVPRKRIPRITYLRDRMPDEDFYIPASVYEERLAQYEQRIRSMLEYASGNVCRSKYMLEYFGQHDVKPCGHCDYCLEQQKNAPDTATLKEQILRLLADGNTHTPEEIRRIEANEDIRSRALQELTEASQIRLINGLFMKG